MAYSMKIVILMVVLLTYSVRLTGQSDSLEYVFEFVDEIGCMTQLKSFNSKIDNGDLNNLVSILNIPSSDRGLRKEFPFGVFYDIKPSRPRSYYKAFSDSSYQVFKNSCLKLKSFNVSEEFNELKDTILSNYLKRLSFNNIVRRWIADNNYKRFKAHVESMMLNKDITMILDSIEHKSSFHDKLWVIQFKLYNYLNAVYFPFSIVTNTEKRLLNKHHLKFESEICED